MNEPTGNPVSLDSWEQQYNSGFWSYLASAQELARYAAIAGYVNRLSNGNRVLDVGCGECILYDFLARREGAHYTGLDLSPAALAKSKVPETQSTLIAADVEEHEFENGEQFDAIVFNEILYYPKLPIRVLDRLAKHLAPGGLVVVSMYHSPDPASAHARTVGGIWRAIDQGNWTGLDETAVTNIPTRRTWRIRAMNAKS